MTKTGSDTKAAAVKTEHKTKPKPHKMMFIFSDTDCQTTAFISEDPIFAGVKGYQADTTFVTKEMFEHMKQEIVKNNPMDEATRVANYHAEDCEDMCNFIYGFAECMKRCRGGEMADAMVLVRLIF